MTSSQPPQQPGGHGQPGHGHQPGIPGTPPYGQAPYGQAPYGQAPYGQAPYGQAPHGQHPYGRPVGAGGPAFDLKRLRVADYVVAGGALAYLVLAVLPWVSIGDYYYPGSGYSVSGFQFSGLVSLGFVLFLCAAVWALLPALTDLKLGFPRGWITVGLAGLGLLLTLGAWIQTFSALWDGFSIVGLLAILVAAAITAFAVLGLLPELRNRPALPGGLANAAEWANQQAPQFGGTHGGPAGQPGGAHRQPQHPDGQHQPYTPPAPAGETFPAPPHGQPGAPGRHPGQPSGGA